MRTRFTAGCLLAASVFGCGSAAPPVTAPTAASPASTRTAPRRDQSPPVDTTAEELAREYKRDEAAAAERFGDRLVAVEGEVAFMGGTGRESELRFRTGDGATGVVARYTGGAGAIRVGQRVRVVGVCGGRRPGAEVVTVDHCTPPTILPGTPPR